MKLNNFCNSINLNGQNDMKEEEEEGEDDNYEDDEEDLIMIY
jgi:hypothetical protein